MFRKKQQANQSPMEEAAPRSDKNNDQPKHPTPRILLIDMPTEAKTSLQNEGYNVVDGSFGIPYRVPISDDVVPVIPNYQLPNNYPEQHIVVVDLLVESPLDQPIGKKATSEGVLDVWAPCSWGIIDPRPRAMTIASNNLERILDNRGVIVIFAAPRYEYDFAIARVIHRMYDRHSEFKVDNWSFLPILSSVGSIQYSGNTVTSQYPQNPLGQLLERYAQRVSVTCTLAVRLPPAAGQWLPLAKNMFGQDIAGMLIPSYPDAGQIFIFPQLEDKTGFLTEFVTQILPHLAPHLFPHIEGARWVYRDAYELPSVQALRAEVEHIRAEAERSIKELEDQIAQTQADNTHVYELLRGTGTPLVAAIKKSLEELGFKNVVDMDEERAIADPSLPKREDLQVRDESPLLLIEAKGVNGLPKESSALQVGKYVAPRMRELGRTDIQGLAIINHQRAVPALDREHHHVFSEDILTNAADQAFGLLTTWDLYRLLRNARRFGWTPDQVKPLFYQTGRLEVIPSHYEFVGVVEHFWEKVSAVGVRIERGTLVVGDHIAFEQSIEFEVQVIESLQVERTPVEKAEVGELAGIATTLPKSRLKDGVRVFRITNTSTVANLPPLGIDSEG